jgi:chemotaxis protein CheD
MQQIVLGVGEYGATGTPGSQVKTFALGSCVAVCVYDTLSKIAGMVHVALPHSSTNPARAKALPGYFADTGIDALFRYLAELRGGEKKGLLVKLCGGANVMRCTNLFDIGKRNVEAVKFNLARRGLLAIAEDVGGSISRTVTFEVDTGYVVLSSPGRTIWKL